MSRDYYVITMGPPPSGGDSFSAETIRADYEAALSGARNVWRKVLRFLPDEQGKCDDAGMLVRVEIGPRGKVHTHCLFYGAFHRVEAIREAYREKVPGAVWNKVNRVKAGQKGTAGAVAEVCKYLMKASVSAGVVPTIQGDYVHPLVGVVAELALYRRKRTVAYGTMKGMKKAADKAMAEQDQERDSMVLGECLDEPCPKCGGAMIIHIERRGEPWVPEGWARKKKRGPPEGCET